MNDNFDWTNGIVAIYGDKRQPVGTGFVVSAEGLIATCAHVLQQAGWRFRDWNVPVQIRFKSSNHYAGTFVLESCYRPQHEGDVAILALKEPLPDGVEVLLLTEARTAVGHRVSTWGYPKYRATGIGGSGEVVNLIPGNWGQLIEFDSGNTTLGYSGGPVWDSSLGRVIGMISDALTADDSLGRHRSTNLAVPAEALVDLCPDRLVLTPPADPLEKEDLLALQAYLSMVARRSNRLPLAQLDPGQRESAYLNLAQVYVGLDAGEVEVPGNTPDTVIRYAAALGHIHENRRLILLGDPGSGKTTLLRFISLCLAQAQLSPASSWLRHLTWSRYKYTVEWESEQVTLSTGQTTTIRGRDDLAGQEQLMNWPADARIPIYVTVRDMPAEGVNGHLPTVIWDQVVRQLEEDRLPETVEPLRRKALAGQVIFLLDGVDEVPQDRRADVWRAIAALGDGPFGGNRWVATCRVLSFVKEEAPPGVPSRTLRPLDEHQTVDFIKSWYRALAESREQFRASARDMTNSLLAAVERPRLRSLAQNPMLLTIMALIQTHHGALPDERARLYQTCVETLLLRWQRHKERTADGESLPEPLVELGSQDDLQRLLWEIAWKAHSNAADPTGRSDIPESEVMVIALKHFGRYTKAETFLEYTERRAHLLIGRGGVGERVFAFPHRTFQEYLAACYVANEPHFARKAAEFAQEPSLWRETLTLATGTLCFNNNAPYDAIDSIERVLPREVPEPDDEAGWNRIWMAGEMMAVVGRGAAEEDEYGCNDLPKLRQKLVALLEGGHLAATARAEAGDALGRIGDPRQGACTRLPDMIYIQPGAFFMGSDPNMEPEAKDNTRPQCEIGLPAFAIARYPVTNAQYRYFVEDGGYTEKWRDCWTAEGWRHRMEKGWTAPRFWDADGWPKENRPVLGISWYEALAYAKWLSRTEGQAFGLPTEAQWERAARDTDGRQFPWPGDWQDGIVNSKETGIGQPTAVGTFPKGQAECGAHDMAGNVWEWTSSVYESYPYEAGDGREDETSVDDRVLRGGSFSNPQKYAHASYREYLKPYVRADRVGVRLVANFGSKS